MQGLEQSAAAGSASGAVAMLGAGLAAIGFRGAANRLVATRVDGRLIALASALVAIAVLLALAA